MRPFFSIWIGIPWLQTLALASESAAVAMEPAQAMDNLLWGIFRVVGYVVFVPVIEELAFRGYLLRFLVNRDFQKVSLVQFTWGSFLGSSLLFGLAHANYWISGTLAGMAYAVAARRRAHCAMLCWLIVQPTRY